MIIIENHSLAEETSWRVGGLAQYASAPSSIHELQQVIEWAKRNRLAFSIISGGSNLLVSDQGLQGLVVLLKNLKGTTVDLSASTLRVRCLAGTRKSELLKIFLRHQVRAAEFLAGIPGDVGGGVVMNAGVSEMISPREFVDIVEWIDVLRTETDDLRIERISAEALSWSYRHCRGWEPGVIVEVGIRCEGQPDPAVLERVRLANRLRASKQPLELPSCGSVFINPPGQRAGQLIESCGLKGFAIGGAQVSTKHANFIVNTGAARAIEIWQVIQHVQKTVREKAAVELKTEVVCMGRF